MDINDVAGLLRQQGKQILAMKNLSNRPVSGLAVNSKLVKKGYIFFALKGERCDGYDFIRQAYYRGASAIISEREIRAKHYPRAVLITVRDAIKCLAEISGKFYGMPSENMDMSAVTGTNGKTTVTYIYENILRGCGKKTGVIGTINYRYGNKIIEPMNTTPDILTLQCLLYLMRKKNIRHCIVEVSSHALAQRRIEGACFDRAIFTNLTQDHLDYHLTKRDYFRAKLELFKRYLKDKGVSIINIDDDYGKKIKGAIKGGSIITYGLKNKAFITARKIKSGINGSHFLLKYFGKEFPVATNLTGVHNIYNILAAVGACVNLNLRLDKIISGLRYIYIPGRLEKVFSGRQINIFVDYAHTEDALKNVISCIKSSQKKGRMITVFGCGGGRDKQKRPKMGGVVSDLCDVAIITSDNPRDEDPRGIIEDIRRGIRKTNYIQVTDRYKAIAQAIDIAKENDIILVAGKGHENYQLAKGRKVFFDDREAIREIVNAKFKKY